MKNNLNLLHNAVIIFNKDLQLEFRTRYAINAIFLFGITTLVVVSFSIGGKKLTPDISSSLLWIILFFSSMSALSHIFIREEEQQTADTLRLVTKPNSVFLGKWLFNLLLLLSLDLIILPLFIVFINLPEMNIFSLGIVVFMGSLALSTVATIIAAIISKASGKGALYAVLSFPISITILVSAINGTKIAFQNLPFNDCLNDIQVLFSFFMVMFTISILVFEFIWRD